MSKFKIPGGTGRREVVPSGNRTYAQSLGARPATAEEKQQAVRQGILRSPTTRAYTLPDGTVLSNREMQQRASFIRYGERLTLEQRADILARTPDYRAGAGVKSNWVRGVMKDSRFRGMSYRQVERSEGFKEIWDQWKYLREKKGGDKDAHGIRRSGKFWNGQRLKFLKRYHVVHYENGHWVS